VTKLSGLLPLFLLATAALPQVTKLQKPGDVHFQPEGCEVLAKAVAASIEVQLRK
jgi:lysophospholipase L1-like esterase